MYSRKRIFLGLFLILTVFILLALAYFILYFQWPDYLFFQYSFYILTAFLVLVAAIALLVMGILVLSLIKGKPVVSFKNLVQKTLVFFFPLVVQLGRVFRIPSEKIQSSFIAINNRLIEVNDDRVTADQLLLLLPHCLQDENCPYKITRNPYNCQRCGKCPVGQLLDLADKWHVELRVVTGGTLARQAVKAVHPKYILAVACERDLSSGIVDSFPLPVYGVLNERPNGPCFNTLVSLERVEEQLKTLLNKQGQ